MYFEAGDRLQELAITSTALLLFAKVY